MKLFVYIWSGYNIEIFAESREDADAFLKPDIEMMIKSGKINPRLKTILVYPAKGIIFNKKCPNSKK